jgi:multidrug resistance efflux pump
MVIYARPQFRFLPAAIALGATIRPEQLVFLLLPMDDDPETKSRAEAEKAEPADERDVMVVSEVEGRTTILSIVPGGKEVKRGELVCELDSSALRDQLASQAIATRGAEAAYQNARLTREVAELAVEEYAEGVSRQEKAKLQGEIDLAKKRIELARERIERAGRIPEANEADDQRRKAELDLKQEQRAQEEALDQLRLLTKYTHPRTIKALKTEAEKARAEELARQATWDREKAKQARLEREIARCKIVAPEDGRVIYDQRGPDGKRLIEPGATIRHRQLIFRIVPSKPDAEAPK